MYNGNMKSLKTVLWKVFNRPVTEGLNYEDAAEYAIEALRLVGAPLVFLDKTTEPITLVNYKAALPCDMINIRGVKLVGCNVPLRRATDLYHTSKPCEEDDCNDTMHENTYIAQNGVIQTSVREGEIIISYKGLALDEDGYPLIPDNPQILLAVEYYVLYRYLEPLWEMGKVTDKVFERTDQKKCFYMSSAGTSMQLQNMDHLESAMNAVNRLIINSTAYDHFYKGMGAKEIIKKYN